MVDTILEYLPESLPKIQQLSSTLQGPELAQALLREWEPVKAQIAYKNEMQRLEDNYKALQWSDATQKREREKLGSQLVAEIGASIFGQQMLESDIEIMRVSTGDQADPVWAFNQYHKKLMSATLGSPEFIQAWLDTGRTSSELQSLVKLQAENAREQFLTFSDKGADERELARLQVDSQIARAKFLKQVPSSLQYLLEQPNTLNNLRDITRQMRQNRTKETLDQAGLSELLTLTAVETSNSQGLNAEVSAKPSDLAVQQKFTRSVLLRVKTLNTTGEVTPSVLERIS